MMRIPKIIHQTWKDDRLPKAFQLLAQTWRDMLPDWEYRLCRQSLSGACDTAYDESSSRMECP